MSEADAKMLTQSPRSSPHGTSSTSDQIGLRQNLSAVINVEGKCKLQAGARGYYTVQVDHLTALFPQEGMGRVAAIRRIANDLALCIDRFATAARIATKRSKIQNLTVFPPNCVVKTIPRKIG